MVEDFRRGVNHAIQRARLADEVRGQHFDDASVAARTASIVFEKMLGAAVGQVVARDRRDHDMPQPKPDRRLGHPPGSSGRAASVLPLGTQQKPQGRVQTLPRIMNVAVFCG